MNHLLSQSGKACSLTLSGTCPVGSKQNDSMAKVVGELERLQESSGFESLTIDCKALDYSGGDAIASIWLTMIQRGVRCEIMASGKTRAALESLMAMSISVPIVG